MGAVPYPNAVGVAITPLYQDAFETVSLFELQPNAVLPMDLSAGAELFVLDGSVCEHEDELMCHSWLRLPLNSELQARAGEQGARVWLKQGHLSQVQAQIERVQAA